MKLQIQRIDKKIDIPKYMNENDAAFDLQARENKTIRPNENVIIKTGLKVAIPKGYAGLIWDRSGIAAKHGVHALAGVIDSGYRGEIGIVLNNLSDKEFVVNTGDRIAQMLIQPVMNCQITELEDLDGTQRGENGFGSTGIQNPVER